MRTLYRWRLYRLLLGIIGLGIIGFASVAQGATIRAKVLSPDGAPVVGATILAGAGGKLTYSENDGTVLRLKSDEKGEFAVEVPHKPGETPLVFARVQAEKFAVQDTILKLKPEGDTVKMQLPKPVRGIVKDANNAPVADARVRVGFALGEQMNFGDDMGGGGMPLLWSLMAWMNAIPRIETRTDAEGRWGFDNLAMAVLTLQDPRFAPAPAFVGMKIPGVPGGDGGLVTLAAKTGAGLRGRLILPDGKPLAGVLVMSGGEMMGNPITTDADGKFLLEGLPTQSPMIMGLSLDEQWIVPPLVLTQPLQPGKINDAPPWKATRGVEISGLVAEQTTNKPVANARVGSVFGIPQATGADGRFKVRVPKEQAVITVTHPDYAAFYKNFDKIGDAATFDVGRINIERALMLQGRLLDEKGQPVNGVLLMANSETTGQIAQTGADGAFKMRIAAGVLTVRLQNQNDEWELLPADSVKVTLNEKTAPLELKARKLPTQLVKGRVVTTGGKPVGKAMVSLSATLPGNENVGGTRVKTAETDAEGRFSVTFSGKFKDAKVAKVEGGNYVLRQPGHGKMNGADFEISDTIVAPLTAQISGRVVDANGVPLAGALVASPETAKFETVKTDADGRFTLKNLPEGEAAVLAAQGRIFARATVKTDSAKTDAEAEIRVAPLNVLVPSMQRQFFSQFLKDDGAQINSYRASLGVEKRFALALQKDGALPPGETALAKTDWSKAGAATQVFVQNVWRHDVAWLAQNGPAFLAKMPVAKDAAARFDTEFAVARLCALRGDDAARLWANNWLSAALKQKDTTKDSIKNADRLFQLAGLAGALNRPETDGLVIGALNFAENAGKKAIEENSSRWGGFLATGGVALFATLEDEWPASAKTNARLGAAHALLRFDPARAKIMLDKWFPGFEDSQVPKNGAAVPEAPIAVEAADPNGEKALRSVQDATQQWHIALAETNPAAELDWQEKKTPGVIDWQLLPKIVRAAVAQKQFDVARRAIEPVLKQNWAPNGLFAYFGALFGTFDRDLAAQLLGKADKQALDLSAPDMDGALNYGYFRAQSDPALARLWLEWTWQRALAARDPENPQMSGQVQGRVAAAMTALDTMRAVEMFADAPDNWTKNTARAHIVAYLLADDAERALLRAENE